MIRRGRRPTCPPRRGWGARVVEHPLRRRRVRLSLADVWREGCHDLPRLLALCHICVGREVVVHLRLDALTKRFRICQGARMPDGPHHLRRGSGDAPRTGSMRHLRGHNGFSRMEFDRCQEYSSQERQSAMQTTISSSGPHARVSSERIRRCRTRIRCPPCERRTEIARNELGGGGEEGEWSGVKCG